MIIGVSLLHLSVIHIFEVRKGKPERLNNFLKAHSHTVVKQELKAFSIFLELVTRTHIFQVSSRRSLHLSIRIIL
jgi:hypothetical protein